MSDETNFDDLIKMSRERMRERSEKRKAQWESLFPMTVDAIVVAQEPIFEQGWHGDDVGRFVAIRPVKSIDPQERTYLGIYIGDIALSNSVQYVPDGEGGRTLIVKRVFYNPAIFIPDLRRVVFGAESWWGVINSEADLKRITDLDIENVWYVRALKELAGRDEEE